MKASKLPVFNVSNLEKGIFLTRPNSFVAKIEYHNKIELAHIHNQDRLKELLIEGRKG